jgi:hypothetical protein
MPRNRSVECTLRLDRNKQNLVETKGLISEHIYNLILAKEKPNH